MTVEHPGTESYQASRDGFAHERLRVLYYLGFVANPVFLIPDALLYRDHFRSLLLIRLSLEAGLLLAFWALLRRPAWLPPTRLLMAWILIGNLHVVAMTAVLGGFTAHYYNGLNLVFLAASVIVPISWTSHLTAQAIVLAAYYGVNGLLGPTTPAAMNAAIENSFFLVWTCIAVLFAVYFYERAHRAEFDARQAEARARAELEASNRKLLELDRLKSDFFANISHELRTPLTLILGSYKSLLRGTADGDRRQLIETGINNATRLLTLINQLLDLAKFDSGRTTLRATCVDFTGLVRHVAANFESSERYRIHFEGLTAPVAVVCDSRQVKTVLYNLLSNAFKFNDPVAGRAWLRLRASDDWVELDVEDNGIGIPQEALQRIFERFTQVEGSATRQYEGTGIGLALVKEILELHGGRVQVKSRVGAGSTFTVTLPRGAWRHQEVVPADGLEDGTPARPLQSAAGGVPANVAAPAAVTHDAAAPLVLVAEDNDDMRAYLERVLAPHWRVLQARDGAEALELARARQPDLIITDAMMPRMSGDALLEALRADEALTQTPVIFLTARAGTEARVESLEGGADDYVTKPFDERELVARVQNLLRAREQDRRIEELHRQLVASQAATIDHLTEMNRLKSQFVAHVSHELRTPLTSISGFADNMLEGVPGPITDRQREYLGRLKANCGRLNRMIGDLLDRARHEAGKLTITRRPVNVTTVAADVVAQLRHLASAKGQRLAFEGPDSPLMASADEDRLFQIVTNLVENAIKYTPAGGAVTVHLAAHRDGKAAITVTDTGDGIPAEALPRLFDPFYRTARHERSAVKGLGLGLSIVKELVELHEGTITVESEAGKGSTFRVMLPLLADRAAPAAPAGGPKRILVVDDDPDIRRLMADRLMAAGHAVETAASGEEALAALRGARYDGVFLDLALPQIGGMEVLRHSRDAEGDLPVVVMTASGAHESAARAVADGARAALLKPFDEQAIMDAVRRWF